jgi:arylamine N-acetyltransferase
MLRRKFLARANRKHHPTGSMLNVPAYLRRINYAGTAAPTPETLREVHRAHLFAVPFENLDIHIGRKIVCDEDTFLHKIVNERRGGFCYELNGAFAALLRALGFQVTLLSARVARSDGSDSPEFDHLTLRVDLDEPWLVDVGFGDSFLEPLRLEASVGQPQIGRIYRVQEVEGAFGILSVPLFITSDAMRFTTSLTTRQTVSRHSGQNEFSSEPTLPVR